MGVARRPSAWPFVACWVAVGVPAACAAPSTPDPDPVDTDGDGLSDTDERQLYGTSPFLADTDGDGMSDRAEIVDFGFDPAINPYLFNPRIADVPEMALVFTSSPSIRVIVTDSKGTAHTLQDTQSQLDSVTDTQTSTEAHQETESISTPTTVTHAESRPAPADAGADARVDASVDAGDAGEEAGDDAGDASVDASVDAADAAADAAAAVRPTLTDTISATYNPTETVQATLTFSAAEARQNAITLSLAEAYADTTSVTELSGTLKVTAAIENRGQVAFRVTTLILAGTIVKGAQSAAPLGNLTIDTPWLLSQPFALAPGEATAPVNFIKVGLPLEQTIELIRDMNPLGVRLAIYEIVDANGRPYSFEARELRAKTAPIVIDYGGRRAPEHHLVATKTDGAHPGITAGRALREVLRMPFESDPEKGLASLRDVGPRASGAGHWEITQIRDDGVGPVIRSFGADDTPYDFDGIELQAGDVLKLVWVEP